MIRSLFDQPTVTAQRSVPAERKIQINSERSRADFDTAVEMAEDYQDIVVLTRDGDSYIAFDNSADVVSEICGTTVREYSDGSKQTIFHQYELNKHLQSIVSARVSFCILQEK